MNQSVDIAEVNPDVPTLRYYVTIAGQYFTHEFDITRELTEFEKTILEAADGLVNNDECYVRSRCAEAILFANENYDFDDNKDLTTEELDVLDKFEKLEYTVQKLVPVDKRGTLSKFMISQVIQEPRKPLGGPFTRIYRFWEIQ
jgi:hypothetical protein